MVAAHVQIVHTGAAGKVVQIFAHIPSQVGGPPQPRLMWTWAPWNQPDPEPVPSKLVKVLCEKLIEYDDFVNWLALTKDGRELIAKFQATNESEEEDDGEDLHPEDA